MKKRTVYTDAPPDVEYALEHGTVIPRPDFLPPPDQLVFREKKQKITIMLNESTIDFFKRSARENGVKYQTMINNLLDSYVQLHQ
jgi:uncharacterized protein (DUF4415 family)